MKKPGVFGREAWGLLSLIIISLAATVTAYSAPLLLEKYHSNKSAVHEDFTTFAIYGSGAFYEFDLIRKDYKEIVPSDQEADEGRCSPGYVITRIDNKEKRLFSRIIREL